MVSTEDQSSRLSTRDTLTALAVVVAVSFVLLLILWPGFKKWLGGDSAAGWVQAVGSVAALFLAIWFARSEERDRKERALRAGRVYADQLVLRLHEAVWACEENDMQRMNLLAGVFTELQAMGHDVPIGDLPANKVDAFMQLRMLNSQAGWNARAGTLKDPVLNNWIVSFQALRNNAGEIMSSFCGSE